MLATVGTALFFRRPRSRVLQSAWSGPSLRDRDFGGTCAWWRSVDCVSKRPVFAGFRFRPDGLSSEFSVARCGFAGDWICSLYGYFLCFVRYLIRYFSLNYFECIFLGYMKVLLKKKHEKQFPHSVLTIFYFRLLNNSLSLKSVVQVKIGRFAHFQSVIPLQLSSTTLCFLHFIHCKFCDTSFFSTSDFVFLQLQKFWLKSNIFKTSI